MATGFPSWLMRALAGVLSPGGRRARLSVLIYHRVPPEPDPMNPGDPDAARFRWQMRLLAEHFNVLPLAEAEARLARDALPPRAACVTFDDGYADNVEVALPILQEHGIPATFFVATGYLDGGLMFNDRILETLRRVPAGELDLRCVGLDPQWVDAPRDRHAAAMTVIRAVKYLDAPEREARVRALSEQSPESLPDNLMMSAAQLRRLAGAGMEIGGHTRTHPILTRVTDAQAWEEIAGGREDLEALLRQPVRLFAYPNGRPGQDYDARHPIMVRRAGFAAAVSTASGVSTRRSDRYQLPRFTPWDPAPHRFAVQLVRNLLRGTPPTA